MTADGGAGADGGADGERRLRLRLDVAYDGTDLHGWAAQPGLRTVEATLADALGTVLRAPEGTVALVCAGRTDAGVHARGQVVHVDVEPGALRAAGDTAGLLRRVNGLLDGDRGGAVRVLRLGEAPPGFDARFGALWRRYAYRVADHDAAVDPLARRHVLRWPRRLDLAAMQAASADLLGLHDFAAFCRRRDGATTVRTLHELRWERDAGGVAVGTVRADAFCHSMVRALVGCLVAVGEGRKHPSWPGEVLAAGVRDPAVTVVHAHGLTLEEVGYPADGGLADRAEQTMARRAPVGGTG